MTTRVFVGVVAGAAVLGVIVMVSIEPRAGAQSAIVWFADYEEPGDADWYFPGGPGFGGGQFNSGCTSDAGAGMAGTSFVKWRDVDVMPLANGGEFGLMLASVTTCGGPGFAAGTRLFRWQEPKLAYPNQGLYYKVWFYFPQSYRLTGSGDWWFWNVLQWKSRVDITDDVFFSINILNRSNGNMFFVLRDLQGCQCNLIPLAEIDVPINRWFYVEGYYDSQEDAAGQVKVWQGDEVSRTLLYDVAGIRTKFSGGDTSWSVNNYTSGLAPQPAYFFIDNAEIRAPMAEGAGQARTPGHEQTLDPRLESPRPEPDPRQAAAAGGACRTCITSSWSRMSWVPRCRKFSMWRSDLRPWPARCRDWDGRSMLPAARSR